MKKYVNELKLKLKEQLRVIGRGDLNKPEDYLVKRRKFNDVDIAKDFEKRLHDKSSADYKKLLELEGKDLAGMSLEELEEYNSQISESEESDKSSEIYNKMILTDIKYH